MTILIKYPYQTKKRNKIFFEKKDQELTNLDWAKWAGWFDTDGSFTTFWIKKSEKSKSGWDKKARLNLKDRQPVELFSKIFETSLRYTTCKTITPLFTPKTGEPYRREYIANIYAAQLKGEKVRWFTKNVFPYLIKQEKKDYAATLLGYRPESKNFEDWTADEITHYLATAVDGDGHIHVRSGKKTKSLTMEITSSDVQYLSDIKYLAEDKLGLIFALRERSTYETQKEIKTGYRLNLYCSQKNPDNLPFFQNLAKDNVMTLDRKKQKIQEFMNYEKKF